MLRALLWLCFGVTLIAVVVGARWWHSASSWSGQPQVVVVEPGATMGRVASTLASQGMVTMPKVFALVGRLTGADRDIRAGHYQIEEAMSPRALMRLLVSGEAHSYQITLVEGQTFKELLATVQAHPHVQSELSGVKDPWIADMFKDVNGPEGWLFPDTYYFLADTTDKAIILRAYQAMISNLDQVWEVRVKDLPLATPYQALILASIIEKETSLGSERADIAGVFVRRLNKKMRLQTDPTIIYGLGERYAGDITRAHLRDKNNIYNTYQHHGLPPTPIASPGRASLEAAVRPSEGTALYFVADGEGGHVFSDTLAEHEVAVRAYLNKQKQ
jgi:UPF0755 protein